MIKVVNLISVIIAPIIVQYNKPSMAKTMVITILLAIVIWAIFKSKREAKEVVVKE
jgi:uncharacterized membrane-anchored protein YitT (DUF2179 family)